CQHYYTSPYSL
nr:immunoglobulin light chain junction region [Macaca mulatta]